MDLIQFLKTLVPTDLGGVGVVAAVIGGLLFKALDLLEARAPLPTKVKFWGSLVGAVAIPVAALGLLIALGAATFSFNALFLVLCAGAWVVSQILHGAFERKGMA